MFLNAFLFSPFSLSFL